MAAYYSRVYPMQWGVQTQNAVAMVEDVGNDFTRDAASLSPRPVFRKYERYMTARWSQIVEEGNMITPYH